MLTKCRLGGTTFYVRENLAPSGGHFHVSAGERMGWKQGRLSGRHQQVLELAAPRDQWQKLARLVQGADYLKRPVRQHRRFTIAWAETYFTKLSKETACPSKPTSD